MGYSFDKELHVLDSDIAADFLGELGTMIVKKMKNHEKVKGYGYNTDGILNVAMILQDCFKDNVWKFNDVMDYAREFIPRFEQYIEKNSKVNWENEENKQNHIKAYKKILANIKRIVG